MKTIAFLFALPAAISALDIRFYSSSDCTGDSWICTNWEPDVCCASPGGGALIHSLGFFGILPEWTIQVKGYNGGACNFLKTVTTAHDTSFKCLTDGPYTGAGYGFVSSSKRSVQSSPACTSTQVADYFQTSDGTIYSIAALSDAEAAALTDGLVSAPSNQTTDAQ